MNIRRVLTISILAGALPLLAQEAATPKPKEDAKVSTPAPKPPEINTSTIWRLALQIQGLQDQMKEAQSQLKDTQEAIQKEQERVAGICAGAGFQLGQLPQQQGSTQLRELGCVAKQEATTAPPPPTQKGK